MVTTGTFSIGGVLGEGGRWTLRPDVEGQNQGIAVDPENVQSVLV